MTCILLQSPYRTAKVSSRIKADILSLTLCGNFQTHCRFVFSLRQPSAHLTSLQRTTFIQKIPVSPEFFIRRAHLLLKRSLPSLFLKTAAFFRILNLYSFFDRPTYPNLLFSVLNPESPSPKSLSDSSFRSRISPFLPYISPLPAHDPSTFLFFPFTLLSVPIFSLKKRTKAAAHALRTSGCFRKGVFYQRDLAKIIPRRAAS